MSHLEEHTKDIRAKLKFWVALLITCQILDALLTYLCIYISPLGIQGEGNALIRHLMQQIGPGPALAVVKGSAIFACFCLTPKKTQIELFVVRFLATIYICVIVSWIYILHDILGT